MTIITSKTAITAAMRVFQRFIPDLCCKNVEKKWIKGLLPYDAKITTIMKNP